MNLSTNTKRNRKQVFSRKLESSEGKENGFRKQIFQRQLELEHRVAVSTCLEMEKTMERKPPMPFYFLLPGQLMAPAFDALNRQ